MLDHLNEFLLELVFRHGFRLVRRTNDKEERQIDRRAKTAVIKTCKSMIRRHGWWKGSPNDQALFADYCVIANSGITKLAVVEDHQDHARLSDTSEWNFDEDEDGDVEDDLPSWVLDLPCQWLLTELEFTHSFNQPVDHLPPSLQILKLKDDFNQRIDHLPDGLLVLRFDGFASCAFNQPIDHLPSSLDTLKLGSNFDQPIDHLPEGLSILLIMSHKFDYPVDHLPPGLMKLHLFDYGDFSRSLDYLPPRLEELVVGSCFSGSLDHLPVTLQRLTLNCGNIPLDHLPLSLLELSCLGCFDIHHLLHLPPHLQRFSFWPMKKSNPDNDDEKAKTQLIQRLPTGIESMVVTSDFFESIAKQMIRSRSSVSLPASLRSLNLDGDNDLVISKDILPLGLSVLTFEEHIVDLTIESLPPSLTHLYLNSDFNSSLPPLPSTLMVLVLGHYFDQPLEEKMFPDDSQLVVLIFGDYFSMPLDHLSRWVPHLKKLQLGKCFDRPLDSLPHGLSEVIFSKQSVFDHPLDHLPSSLTILKLGREFQRHPLDHLPPGLIYLRLSRNYNYLLHYLPPQLRILKLGKLFNQPLAHLPSQLIELHLHRGFNQTKVQLPPSVQLLRFRGGKLNNFFVHQLSSLNPPFPRILFENHNLEVESIGSWIRFNRA